MKRVVIYSDGASKGNPGDAGIGVVISDETGSVLREIAEYIGETTNNERTGPWGPADWGLGQAIGDSLGLAHSEADVIGYFRAAGFGDVGTHEFIAGSLSRIAGTRAK